MASARFEELYFIAIFSQRAHEDATRRANRQDIVSYAVGNIHQRNLDFVVIANSSTRCRRDISNLIKD